MAAPGGAVVTIYVKRADVAGARYAAVSGVAAEQTVDELTACWMKQAKLRDVDPSLVTLHRVACSLHKPPPLAEADAKALDDPSLTLVEAGLASTAWLLATVAQAPLPGVSALEAELRALRLQTESTSAQLDALRDRVTHVLPVAVQQHAARCLFQMRLHGDGSSVGVGVFFKSGLAVTACHNLANVRVGAAVFGRVINCDDTEVELVFSVAVRNEALDAALLTCTTAYEHFLEPYTGVPAELICCNMALCAFQTAIQEELPEFKQRIGVFYALCSKLSANNTHMVYQSTSWAGDSGASLLLFDGQLVGIHLGIVNDLQRLKEQVLGADDVLAELASSVNALIDGQSQGCIALLASAFPDMPQVAGNVG